MTYAVLCPVCGEDHGDEAVTTAMKRFAGGFVTQLARLFDVADNDNQARIKAAWPEYWSQYQRTAHELIEREKQEKLNGAVDQS